MCIVTFKTFRLQEFEIIFIINCSILCNGSTKNKIKNTKTTKNYSIQFNCSIFRNYVPSGCTLCPHRELGSLENNVPLEIKLESSIKLTTLLFIANSLYFVQKLGSKLTVG